MNRQETAKLIAMMEVYFPRSFKDLDPDDLVNAWTAVLEDVPYKAVEAGLMCFVRTDTKGFPPSPGQLIDQIQKATSSEMTPGEAWTLYVKAVRNGTYGAEEEFAKLPKEIQRTIGSPSALREAATCPDLNHDVEKALFERKYTAEMNRAKDAAKIPAKVREVLTSAERLFLT